MRGSQVDHPIFRPWVAAVISAVLLLLTFPPFSLRLLALVGLIPWLVALIKSNGTKGFKSGIVFGVVYLAGQMFFVIQLTYRWTHSWPLSIVPWVACMAIGCFYFGFLGWLIGKSISQNRYWAIPFIWIGVELLRSYFPTLAFPWGLLAEPLAAFPKMIQPARVITLFGFSGLIVAVDLVASMLISGMRAPRKVGLWCGSIALTILVGLVPSFRSRPTRDVGVLICQPGIDSAYGNPDIVKGQLLLAADSAIDDAYNSKIPLVVMPEGTATVAYMSSPNPGMTMKKGVSILFGAQRGTGPIYQSAIAYDDGKWSYMDKTRLVVFGEYVPLRDQLPFLKDFNLETVDISAGKRVDTVKAANLEVGPLVCFEEVFPDVAEAQEENGANLLCVISEDDWFVGTPALDQLRDSVVWRAIETGLPIARSATTGWTMAVSANGDILGEAPVGPPYHLKVQIPVPTDPTSGSAWIWFARKVALVFTIFTVFTSVVIRNRADCQ